MAKDKKGQKESAQEQKAPEQARHSAKERPRLRSRFEKEVAPALLKELEECAYCQGLSVLFFQNYFRSFRKIILPWAI